MSLLVRLFRPRVELPEGHLARVEAWLARRAVAERTPLEELRFVVVDTETTGLDVRRDRLLSIGAVAVENLRLCPGESFEVFVRNVEGSERESILVHMIGPQAQAAGEPPEEALLDFLEFAGKDPLVAFHSAFDQAMLDRGARTELGVLVPNVFLDAARLAPALFPEARLSSRTLDDWLGYFGLRAHARHSAAYDAFVTAELFLVLLHRAREEGILTLGQLRARGEPPGRGPGGF